MEPQGLASFITAHPEATISDIEQGTGFRLIKAVKLTYDAYDRLAEKESVCWVRVEVVKT